MSLTASGVLSGENIICLALRAWESPWKNNQQVMARLAQTNRVLYVGPQRSFRESVRSLRSGEGNRQTVERVAEGPFVYGEPWFLSRLRHTRRGARVLNRMTHIARMAHVRRICRRLGFQSPILLVYDPRLASALGSFGEKLTVYYVIDNYDGYFRRDATGFRTLIASSQAIMLQRANLVFAVSEALHRRCLEFNPNSYLVPNGVNHRLFQQVMSDDWLPHDIRGIPHPIIGYVGVMQPSIDFRLLTQMAAQRSDWSFLLVGPKEHLAASEDFRGLIKRQNVYYLGPKPVEAVPYYIKACDVGILPYKDDEAAPFRDSLKLYEYLACGCPIVSSDMPCSRRFGSLVRIATELPEFINGIEMSLAEDGARKVERMALAEQHSWDRRVEVIGELIGVALARVSRGSLSPRGIANV